ncbi:hypothetical protein E2562_033140 [Oryza meyeriana var. granulata]|uniref:DUF834 domain-containing protein n=1 Tax=Oryza meyeriana var. granulata TaxID=110450 RepID=A0A6G1CLI5_9ORYZ|nr:hypothetical protein E2562_033140 [Oryza meyeriana var. granulata]
MLVWPECVGGGAGWRPRRWRATKPGGSAGGSPAAAMETAALARTRAVCGGRVGDGLGKARS